MEERVLEELLLPPGQGEVRPAGGGRWTPLVCLAGLVAGPPAWPEHMGQTHPGGEVAGGLGLHHPHHHQYHPPRPFPQSELPIIFFIFI